MYIIGSNVTYTINCNNKIAVILHTLLNAMFQVYKRKHAAKAIIIIIIIIIIM
jgi:hypothetical protein